MIEAKETLNGGINASQSLSCVMNNAVVHIEPITQEKSVKPSEEIQEIVADDGYNSLSKVVVEPVALQSKQATPSEEEQSIKADDEFNGLKEVTINPIPSDYSKPTGTKTITENGSYDITQYEAIEVDVHKEITLQEKTTTPTKSVQTITPDDDCEGLSQVIVNAIPDEYITPSGTKTITENGTYDIASYSKVITDIHDSEPVIKPFAPRYISFYGYTGSELDDEINNIDTSKMTDFKNMFHSCKSVKTININHFNTSNATSMKSMFYGCNYTTTIKMNELDISNVDTYTNMFQNCYYITEIDLSNLNTTKTITMTNMFNGCSKLTKIDLRNCTFTMSSGGYTNVFKGIPADCEIIVKDDAAKTKVLQFRTDLTNVKTIAELGV